jgi:transcriptional regulator with XRE-family HTH domain
MSQRGLAAKAGVAFRTVQLLEAGKHDARLSTIDKLSAVLGVPKPAAFPWVGDSLAEAADRIIDDSFGSWKVHLFDFVDAFRRSPAASAVERAPSLASEPRVLALFAATVETLCAERGVTPPLWCAGVRPLAQPWFVSDAENLKVSALLESPAAFRRRGVYVMSGFLDRA